MTSKLLVLYVFHEVNQRVRHFIDNCIFYDENIDFVIICNNKNIDFNCPVYVRKIFRDNIGYDFGGWSDALLVDEFYKHYHYFLFVNSSVIGPFLPKYYIGRWTDIFINGLKRDNVKLFGSTINTSESPVVSSHVQSYIFCMEKPTLEHLIDCAIFSITEYVSTFHDAIWQKEVRMSREIIKIGGNIASLFTHYDNVDFTFTLKAPGDYNIPFYGDIMEPQYRNHLWNEYELVFIKGNRGGNCVL